MATVEKKTKSASKKREGELTEQDAIELRKRAFDAIKKLSKDERFAIAFVLGRSFGDGFYKGLAEGKKIRYRTSR